MKKYFPTAIIGLILLIIAIFVFFALKSPDKNDKSNNKNTVSENDQKALYSGWSKGSDQAKVVLTEFGDFQCPACGKFEPVVVQLEKDFAGNIKIIFKEFPLSNLHKNAQLAALSAEAAGDQGKFWQMHDKLYEKQNEWSESNDAMSKFIDYAKQINLDIDRFKNDVENKKFEDRIKSDFSLGEKLNLSGTPSFFVNGVQVDISKEGADGLRQAISNALSK